MTIDNQSIDNVTKTANSIFHNLIKKGYSLKSLHPYCSAGGKVLFYQCRFVKDDGTKEIRSLSFDVRNNMFRSIKPHFGELRQPLYNLPAINQRKGELVFVCEGENCVDALTKLDILATTSGGAQSALQVDWQVLVRRKIIIWPDNDEAGKSYADAVGHILSCIGCEVSVVDIAQLNLPEKGDVVDWVRDNPHAISEDLSRLPTVPYCIKAEEDKQYRKNSPKETTIDLAMKMFAKEFILFRDQEKKVYASKLSSGENYLIDDERVVDLISSELYKTEKRALEDSLCKKLLSILKAKGLYESSLYKVALRVARDGDCYYLDLAQDGNSRAVQIKAGSWEIIEKPPVRFIRPSSMEALPDPVYNHGEYEKLIMLWDIINIPESARLLVLAWLLESFRPDTPFPLLELIGEQGSAKSTTQKYLRRLVDPNIVDLRGAPKSCDDIAVSSQTNHILSYENISHLNQTEQDTLCTISTGGGYSKRQLYSDGKEYIINCKNPILINGINEIVTSQDLVSRTLTVELQQLTKRKDITIVDSVFQKNHPLILGELLRLFSQALSRLPNIELLPDNQPRLIEFVKLGVAMSEELGFDSGRFIESYDSMNNASINRTLDSNSVAIALRNWLDLRVDSGLIDLTMQNLYDQLSIRAVSIDTPWPKSPRGLGNQLRRCAPALRYLGVNIIFL